MPVLTFEHPPPNGKALIDLSSPSKLSPKTTRLHDVNSTTALVQEVERCLPNNAYPVVRLDVDVISEATASRLAASLLGHVLFLKNQIPFPVMQLGRLPGGKTNSRAAKLRTELMASYDTISSHLDTTFAALATALARCSGPEVSSTVAQAHVAILVGPSLGSAKAKVIMGIHGLEKKKIWGNRSAAALSENVHESEDEEDEEESEEEADEDEGLVDVGSEDEGEEVPEDSDNEEDDDEESVSEGADEDEDDENAEYEKDGEEEEADDDDATDSAPPPPYISYAEEQKFLQSADRLLSRVLAAADAEGNGIASEMSPTQTHILIRAPRAFKHPAWIPRQNVSAPLDATLADFLSASGVHCPDLLPAPPAKQSSTKKSKVEGVWIRTRGGINAHYESEVAIQHKEKKDATKNEADLHLPTEDAEMIWWSWDGKFVGFSDW